MSGHAEVPDGVDEKSAALLRRAYDLEDVDTGQQLYVEWADTYDATMLGGLGYVSPRLVAAALAAHSADVSSPVLDIGCGTGLVGQECADRGFTTIDGLDLSLAMMDVAARRGVYRNLVAGDLRGRLPLDTGTYAAAVCAGTFTSGHVDAGCLPELLRVLAAGGLLVCTVHHAVWEPLGFAAGFARLLDDGLLDEVSVTEVGFYENTTADGRLLVLRVR
jgi:predicted TPR repeat methyltransferase